MIFTFTLTHSITHIEGITVLFACVATPTCCMVYTITALKLEAVVELALVCVEVAALFLLAVG